MTKWQAYWRSTHSNVHRYCGRRMLPSLTGHGRWDRSSLDGDEAQGEPR